MASLAERTARRGLGAFVAFLLVVGWSGSATAAPIEIGGVDVQSQYTGFVPVPPDTDPPADAGVFTFYDSINGSNPNPEPGTVTTESQTLGLIGGRVELEIMLDTSSFDPATGSLLDASFIGTGATPEIVIWDSTQTTVLLAFDVSFVDVAVFTPEIPGLTDSIITLGDSVPDSLGVLSSLSVVGGTLASAVGGEGTLAVLRLTISKPDPQVTVTNFVGYLDDSFAVGIPGDPPTLGVNWEITIVPEPGTFLLVCGSLAAFAALSRRRRSRN